jgi:DNA-binding NtrC family response regulator
MHKQENFEPTCAPTGNGNRNFHGTNAVCRLRLLIAELIQEVELIDYGYSPSVESRLQQTDKINFYEEVARFEIALIRNALQRTKGHQVHAARLLNLNSSTLNAKIKQYDIGYHSSNDRWTSK